MHSTLHYDRIIRQSWDDAIELLRVVAEPPPLTLSLTMLKMIAFSSGVMLGSNASAAWQ